MSYPGGGGMSMISKKHRSNEDFQACFVQPLNSHQCFASACYTDTPLEVVQYKWAIDKVYSMYFYKAVFSTAFSTKPTMPGAQNVKRCKRKNAPSSLRPLWA